MVLCVLPALDLGRGLLPAASFLHAQKTLAKRIGPGAEQIAWELVAVSEAVIEASVYGAGQDRAGGAQEPLLSSHLGLGLLARSGAAGGAHLQHLKAASVAIYATGARRHFESPILV